MLLAFLAALAIQLQQPGRTYHKVTLAQLATTRHTHVETCATVASVRRQRDGDWHVNLTDGRVKAVVEIIPAIPLPRPKKGRLVRVRGISRIDRHHRWPEIHPAESIEVVARCEGRPQ